MRVCSYVYEPILSYNVRLNFNSRVVRMTQDQWDIHKLDPEYECIVRPPPAITSINRRLPEADIPQDAPPSFANSAVPDTPEKTVKMEGTTPTPKFRGPAQGVPNLDDDPVFLGTRMPGQSFRSPNQMSVDGDTPAFNFFNQSTPKDPRNKRPRTRKDEKLPSTGILSFDFYKVGSNTFFLAQEKAYIDLQSTSEESEIDLGRTKRTRFRDPFATRRELHHRKAGRERKRRAELDARLRARRDILQNLFWDELGVPPGLRDPTVFSDPTDPEPEPEDEEKPFQSTSKATSEEPNEDDEAIRQATIEESKRKLAELERDKPLWEEAARRRKEQELRAEEERKQAKIRQEEEERKRAAYRRYREQWELERQSHELEMKKQRKGTQMLVASASIRGGFRWSARSALERYTQTATQFDSVKYTASNPLIFQSVPWPMLVASFTINDIQWNAVEKFFKTVEGYLPRNEFRDLVEKSHKRFHPDRWRSRRILTSVQDDLERDLLEVAGSTVAQALTPLWKKVTGRE